MNRSISAAVILLSLASRAAGQVVITEPTRVFNAATDIPDMANPPLVFSQTIANSSISSLTRVEVRLLLLGDPVGQGFASDMVVTLNQNLSQTATLLNRVGLSTSDPVGGGYDGWDVTFNDGAANGDVHTQTSVTSGVLTGNWQPDGRVLPTDTARTQLLNVFNGSSGNGVWRLSVGDLESGGTMRLESWSITLTGYAAVPESGEWAGISGGCLLIFVFVRNRKAT
jgi:hypothetical protein